MPLQRLRSIGSCANPSPTRLARNSWPRRHAASQCDAQREVSGRAVNLATTDLRRFPMDSAALFLSRIQFAFTISFHIIFPAFTIGLAAWLTVLEALHLRTGRSAYRVLFDFWLKIFGVAFGMGVVSGIVIAFQLGMNWSVLSKLSGPIQGPLLSYETFTACMLEATFIGVLIFGRTRVAPR